MNDLIKIENIENKILVIRGQQVMLDRDLAMLYGVETGRLNEAVKRNKERFPKQFCFQLTKEESNLKSQIAISSWGGSRSNPYAFTEQGVAMLSAVLRSKIAIQVSIDIMNAFVHMRHYLHQNADIINRVNTIENKVDTKLLEYDKNFSKIFNVIDTLPAPIKQDIFSQGQIFDAYSFFQGLIQSAKKEIILIDNYIDLTVLGQLTKKQPGVDVTVYTKPDTPISELDFKKFNKQYPTLTINHTTTMHDRFLILDNIEIYHIGASLKDLGKKCFAFTKMDDSKRMIQTVLSWV
ncbi:MAG: ORF6N domain-containing protein [Spirochaetia bacterium]|nr:ORF6N domain-containing protein [Spirochaetia bacterium]